MKKGSKILNNSKFLIIVFVVFACLQIQVLADSAPISEKSVEIILKQDNITLKPVENNNNKAKNLEYTPKKQEQKPVYVAKDNDKKAVYYKDKDDDKKEDKNQKNLNVKVKRNSNNRVIASSNRKISAIYPIDSGVNFNSYPGYRGPNQLVVYTKNFGKTTGTNEFGKEAVVEDGIVVRLTGANSNIPKNGYVISGHGTGKKWITDNLKIGTKVEIQDRTIKAYTTIDSYRFQAKTKINEVEDILISTKSDYDDRDDKYIYYYLKKAKQQYKKSLKDASDTSLNCAKESIENSSIAFRYTLPFLKDEPKGTWVRPTEKTLAEIQKTLDKMKETGINNVFLETYYHGKTIFPSKVMKEYGFEIQNPNFANVDILAIWVKEAHKRGMKIHCWFESFYVGNTPPQTNPKSILARKPNWQNKTRQKANDTGYVSHPQEHNGYFLDPANPEVTAFLYSLIGEISARYNIDGFNIDYVRYPNIAKENYTNQWGYTSFAREEFRRLYGIDPVDIQPNSSLWNTWCDYRREKITKYIKEVSELVKNRNIMFSAVIFPDYKISLKTKYQDWTKWTDEKYLDAVTPLILTGDDDLAKSMLEEIRKKTPNEIKVYPGLFAGFIESDPEDLLRQIHIIRKLKLQGVILFDWAHLNDNYLDVLKTSVFRQTY